VHVSESFQEAVGTCHASTSCTLYVWTPSTLQATICRDATASFSVGVSTKDVVVGIKKNVLVADLPGFTVLTNYQAVCDGDFIVGGIHGVFDFMVAYGRCASTPSCTYFSLSTVAGTEAIPDRMQNTLWLCRGDPKFVYHTGWISAGQSNATFASRIVDNNVLIDGPVVS